MITFEQLDAWREAKSLAAGIYRLGKSGQLATDFSLRDQARRASVSIMSNIAEGFERLHIAEKRQFYNIARASCGELRSLLHLLREIEFITTQQAEALIEQANRVGRLTSGLLRSLKTANFK